MPGQDYPRYTCETYISTDSLDNNSSTGESTSTSTSARSSNSDGEECEEADDDKATQAKTPEGPPKKAEKHKAERKWEEAGPHRRKMDKQKKTDKQGLIELLQGQQEMMMKAEEQDRLAMQELIKFEMEAKKSHQDFTLAALQELGNIFNKKDWINRTQVIL